VVRFSGQRGDKTERTRNIETGTPTTHTNIVVRSTDHLASSGAEIKNAWSYTPLPHTVSQRGT